jgi:predicted nucleic acid-binding protein
MTAIYMAATEVLVDSSYWLALEFGRDQDHPAATQHWQRIAKSPPTLVITSFIFDEVVTFLNSRGRHAKAVELGNNLLRGHSIDFVYVDAPLLMEGWAYFEQHHDKDYSLTDCISFVVMRKQNISTAFTFDRHFEQAGFQKEL